MDICSNDVSVTSSDVPDTFFFKPRTFYNRRDLLYFTKLNSILVANVLVIAEHKL